MIHKLFLSLSVFYCLLQSCTNHALKPTEYAQYIKDPVNGLQKAVQHEKIYFKAQFQPVDYLCLTETAGKLNEQELPDLRNQFEGLIHFAFSIGCIDHEKDPLQLALNIRNADQLLSYFAFEANNDFYLMRGGDRLPCVVHHYISNNGLIPRIDLVLGFKDEDFKRIDLSSTLIFYFNDRIFGSGLNAFKFRMADLVELPELKIASL